MKKKKNKRCKHIFSNKSYTIILNMKHVRNNIIFTINIIYSFASQIVLLKRKVSSINKFNYVIISNPVKWHNYIYY